MRLLALAVFLLVALSTATTARIDPDMVDSQDLEDEQDRELYATLVDPGDPEEAVLEIVVETIESCVGVPAFRQHATLGQVLAMEMNCIHPDFITEIYHNVLHTVDLAAPIHADEVRSETTRAIYETISCCATESGGSSPEDAEETGGPDFRLAPPDPSRCMSGSRPQPFNRDTPVWITVYYDTPLESPENRDEQLSRFWNYLVTKTDGSFSKHATHPDVEFCLVWAANVPHQSGLDGDVSNPTELAALANLEAGFNEHGDFIVVFGAGRILVSGSLHRGYALAPHLSSTSLEGMYFQYYAYGVPAAGFRVGVHEVGHVFGLDHTSCVDGPHSDWNDYVHMMALSKDRDPSCTPYPGDVYHHHYNFKPVDSDSFEAEHVLWCRTYNPSC